MGRGKFLLPSQKSPRAHHSLPKSSKYIFCSRLLSIPPWKTPRSLCGGSWESTREAFEWHGAKPSASQASWVLSQLPKCINNSIDAQLKHGPFLLEHCYFKRKLIKYRIFLNHSERFDWFNAITRFERFRCTLAPYKKRAKNCQLCSKWF